jgi:Transcriptional regulator
MVNITFQQIEAFLAVAEHLNLTDTAGIMFISQSALSKIITRLENGIGVKLFIRENRGVSLSKEGGYLYEMFKQPYKTMVKAIGEAQGMRRRPLRSLRIGCPGTYDYNSDYDIVKKIIAEYIDKHQDIEVSETIYESESQKEALLFSEVDIIICQGFVVSSLKDVSYMEIIP